MPLIDAYAPGTFCWVDLATSDDEAATHFYAGLFEWTARRDPSGEVLLCRDDQWLCGLYRLSDELQAEGVRPHWQCYVSVADVDAVAARAQTLGATLLAPPTDLPRVARIAAIQDPAGALLGLWQPAPRIGAQRVNEPGALCWNELYAHNTAAAERFYSALLGWRPARSTGGAEVTGFLNGDRPAATMMAIRPEWGDVPPHWAVYFAVADLERTLSEAASLGGRLDYEPIDVPDVGRFAGVEDPQGAHFVAIELAPGAAP